MAERSSLRILLTLPNVAGHSVSTTLMAAIGEHGDRSGIAEDVEAGLSAGGKEGRPQVPKRGSMIADDTGDGAWLVSAARC